MKANWPNMNTTFPVAKEAVRKKNDRELLTLRFLGWLCFGCLVGERGKWPDKSSMASKHVRHGAFQLCLIWKQSVECEALVEECASHIGYEVATLHTNIWLLL